MFVAESCGALVAYFGRTEILDGAGINVLGVAGPLVAFCGEALEGFAVKTNERFLNNGFQFAVAAFHVEHHGDGHTACKPLN